MSSNIQPELLRRYAEGKCTTAEKFAASLLLITGIFLFKLNPLSQPTKAPETLQTYQVPKGKLITLNLNDGSSVQLAGGSTFLYPSSFSGNTRAVTLLSGEAFFKVTHNRKKPFIVHSSGMEIKVLGTQFNVLNSSGSKLLAVTLTEGSISFKGKNQPSKLLKPGQQLTFNKQSGSLEKIEEVDPDYISSWTKGVLWFKSTPLTEVLQKLEIYYGVHFKIEGNPDLNIPLTGKFRQQPLSRILNLMENTTELRQQSGSRLSINLTINDYNENMNLKLRSILSWYLTPPLIAVLFAIQPVIAQNHPDATITIQPKTLKLRQALEQLTEKAGLNFIYSNIDRELEKTITLNPASSTVKNILEQLSAKAGLKLSANGNDLAVKIQARGSVDGTVKTTENQPVAFVTISIKGLKNTRTDEYGRFSFKNVPSGEYTLSISHIGQAAQSQLILVSAEQNTRADFIISGGSTDLEEITVNGNKQNRFKETQSPYVAKIALKNLENPQVYTSVTKELIQNQIIVTYADAIKNVPGVALQLPNQSGQPGGAINSRGFTAEAKLRNGALGMSVGMLDPVNMETLEAIKGPSGALFGSRLTSFGGIFNVVTKKPFENFEGNVSYSVGSFGLSRLSTDINTPLNDEKSLLFRVTAARHHENSYQDAGFRTYTFIAPSLTYIINNKLSINFDVEFIDGKYNDVYRLWTDASYATGAHSPKELSIDYNRRFIGDGLYYRGTNNNFYTEINYQISRNWQSRTNFSHSRYAEKGPWGWIQLLTGNKELELRLIQREYENHNTINVQQNFTGELKIANLRNRILFGLDYLHYDLNSSSAYKATEKMNALNPGAAYDKLNGATLTDFFKGEEFSKTKNAENTYGVYIQDVINLTNNFMALLSLRLDHHVNGGSYDLVSRQTDGNFKQTALSPKFGLVYQPLKDKISLFANYMNGFSNIAPVRQIDGTISIFKPKQGNQLEGGTKFDLFDGKLSSTISYYDIRVSNVTRPDPDNSGITIQDGTIRSKGFEADINANPIEGLNIIAGYGYNNNKYIKAGPKVQGLRPVDAGPKNMVNAWISYKLNYGCLRGLGIGFGGNYADENSIVLTTTSKFTLPSYTVLNASLSYDQPAYRIGFKVNNLNNKDYYVGWASFVPQMPRSFILDFSIKFGKVK
eukprot:gene11763-13723_t